MQVVNFTDVMSEQQLLFWRVMFEELLQKQKDNSAAQDAFSKFSGPAGALSAERADLTSVPAASDRALARKKAQPG